MSDPKLQRELMSAWDPELFASVALHYAEAHHIALKREDLQSRPDPVGAERFVPRAADGAIWPPPGWLPIGLSTSVNGMAVDWHCFEGLETGTPFFFEAMQRARNCPFNRLFAWRMRLEDMLRNAPPTPQPAGFIFHLSRCGSTLVHRMIDASGVARSLSEVPLFEQALQLCLTVEATEDVQHRMLHAIVAGLNNFADDKPLILKLDSWHIQFWPLLHAAFPNTPAIFLYRDPAEVLVSQKRMRGVQAVPQPGIATLCGIANYSTLNLDEYCAHFLAASCRAAADAARAHAVRVINFNRLPRAVFGEVLPHFGLAVSDAAGARMREVARYHSKSPDEHYVSDSEEKSGAAGKALHALAERIVGPSYRVLEEMAFQDDLSPSIVPA